MGNSFSWAKSIMKKDDLYRIEIMETDGQIFESDKHAIQPLILLVNPGKPIKAIFPKNKTWKFMSEDVLGRATFTRLAGMDIYYLINIIRDKSSKFK